MTVHLLTPAADLRLVRVVCGAPDVHQATWMRAQVTCPRCRGERPPCTCGLGPEPDPCPACRTYRAIHRSDGSRRQTPPRPPGVGSEKEFQEVIRQAALASGWLYYHTTDSRNSPDGFVDVLAVRGTHLIGAELKMPGKRPTEAQAAWLDALAGVQHVSSALWFPDDLGTILEVFL